MGQKNSAADFSLLVFTTGKKDRDAAGVQSVGFATVAFFVPRYVVFTGKLYACRVLTVTTLIIRVVVFLICEICVICGYNL